MAAVGGLGVLEHAVREGGRLVGALANARCGATVCPCRSPPSAPRAPFPPLPPPPHPVILRVLLGISATVSLTALVTLTAVYTIVGGLDAVILTEQLQAGVLLIGSVPLLGLSLRAVGGWSGLVTGLVDSGRGGMLHVFQPPGGHVGWVDFPWTGVLLGLPGTCDGGGGAPRGPRGRRRVGGGGLAGSASRAHLVSLLTLAAASLCLYGVPVLARAFRHRSHASVVLVHGYVCAAVLRPTVGRPLVDVFALLVG